MQFPRELFSCIIRVLGVLAAVSHSNKLTFRLIDTRKKVIDMFLSFTFKESPLGSFFLGWQVANSMCGI